MHFSATLCALRRLLPLTLVVWGTVSCRAENIRREKELYSDRLGAETDETMRAWLTAQNECLLEVREGGKGQGEAYFNTCSPANERKILASLEALAAAEKRPEVRAILKTTASCFDQAPKIPAGTWGSDEGKQYEAVRKCFLDKRQALEAVARTYTAENDAYAAALAADTAEGWLSFILKGPKDKHVPAAARRVAELATQTSGEAQVAIDEQLLIVYPGAITMLPPERRVLLVGPRGLRVRDLRKMTAAKVSQAVMVARVRGTSEPYKNFDGDELVALKELGLSDELVTAMLEVTTKLEERKRADDERQAIRSEIATLKTMIAEKKAEGAKGGEVVQTKEGPMDVLASCAKRLSAMKLCEQIPFPGSTICSSSAESAFPCPKP